MKAVINGTRYDTDKAVLIGEADSGDFSTDFQFWKAALYVTPRSRRYFLAGRGGPMSVFSRSVGQNEWSGGEKIIPLECKDALTWAERHLETREVEAHFAGEIEDA